MYLLQTLQRGYRNYFHSFIAEVCMASLQGGYSEAFCGARWLIGRFDAFRPKGRGFESRSSRHVKTLGKSFTRSCLWCFGVILRHSIHAVLALLEAPLSSSGLEEVL